MPSVNESALRLLLAPVSQCQTIGHETGSFARDGVSSATSPHGSVRYVFCVAGRPVSALQVMVNNVKAVATNVYTDPGFRRQGLAAQLFKRAMINHPALEFSEERSEDGAALVDAVLRGAKSRPSNKTLAATLRRMAAEAPYELSVVLFNWNESSLGEKKDCILRHPGRDGRFSRGAEGGKDRVKISDLLDWLKSDAPFDRNTYGPKISAEWRYQVCRLRHLAGIRPNSFYEALLGMGLARLPDNHARNYTFADGEMLPTLQRGGVRVSMSSGTELYEDKGRVMAGIGKPEDWAINALLVDPEHQRKGIGTKVMREIVQLADQFGVTLYLEAVPIYDKALSREQLESFYAKLGFAGAGKVKVRAPGARLSDLPQDLLNHLAGTRAVDYRGLPLVLYHGTKGEISELRPSRGGEYGSGIYLTPDPGAAWKYAEWAKGSGAPNIIPVYACIKNPYMATGRETVRALGQIRLKALGHDGIIASAPNGDRQYIVFSADQLRSTFAEAGARIERERPQP